ncbi:MAG: ferrous iron transport protein A [Phycisphaera sp.]|nr:ferrous iron transport protein A [Phycisphaera sp.]
MIATAEKQYTPLRCVRVGDEGRLVVDGKCTACVQRLMAMGLTPGTPVKVVRVAPLGDPIILEAPGFKLSLRKHEADGMFLEPLV